MPTVKIEGRTISVDIREELEAFDWPNARWSESKLIASSPFRYDRSPSFAVFLTGEYAGTFVDSGYYDPEWKSGNLSKLLAFLRNETYEECVEYLLSKYDYEYNIEAEVTIDFPVLSRKKGNIVVPESVYVGRNLDHSYLIKRGIHPKVIELQGVFDEGNAIGIPWRGLNGDVLNIKYRLKHGKTFWYIRGATPINRLVYGLDTVVQRGITSVVICEAEIDAMTWQSAGIYAIAVGGVSFNRRQADLILQSGVTAITLGGDNDKAGQRFNERIAEVIGKYVDLYDLDYGDFGGKKDANDVGVTGLKRTKKKRRGITTLG